MKEICGPRHRHKPADDTMMIRESGKSILGDLPTLFARRFCSLLVFIVTRQKLSDYEHSRVSKLGTWNVAMDFFDTTMSFGVS